MPISSGRLRRAVTLRGRGGPAPTGSQAPSWPHRPYLLPGLSLRNRGCVGCRIAFGTFTVKRSNGARRRAPVFAYFLLGMPCTLARPFAIVLELFLFPLLGAAILYSAWPFVVAALRAIRSGGANMAVLIILSVGTGYLISVGATLIWGGRHFYEVSAILLVFILLGHWLELRARRGVCCDQQADQSVPNQSNGSPSRS